MAKYFSHKHFMSSTSTPKTYEERWRPDGELWGTPMDIHTVFVQAGGAVHNPFILAAAQEWLVQKRPDEYLILWLRPDTRHFFVESGLFRWLGDDDETVVSVVDPLVLGMDQGECAGLSREDEDRLDAKVSGLLSQGNSKRITRYVSAAIPALDTEGIERPAQVMGVRLRSLPEKPADLWQLLLDRGIFCPVVFAVDEMPEEQTKRVQSGEHIHLYWGDLPEACEPYKYHIYLHSSTQIDYDMCSQDDLEGAVKALAKEHMVFWDIVDLRDLPQ